MITTRYSNEDDVTTIHRFISVLEEQDFDLAAFRGRYLHNLSNADNIYLVATTADNQIAGFISCHGQTLLHHAGKVFEIQEMFVDKLYRGKGIGKQLVMAVHNILANREYESFEVTTNNKRADARRFYAACGFTETHVKFTRAAQ